MATKEEMADTLRETTGLDIGWENLTKADMEAVSEWFSDPQQVLRETLRGMVQRGGSRTVNELLERRGIVVEKLIEGLENWDGPIVRSVLETLL